jgi:hypothetical protein
LHECARLRPCLQAGNFTWIRNLYTEEPVVVGAQDCDARAPCSAEPATICPFVK